MKLLLRLAVRGAVVSSLLLLGCSQGHRTSTAPPIAVIASPTRLVASQPPPLTHPPIHIIAVSPVGAAEEQETAMIAMPVQPNSAPPLIVRGACADEPNAVVPFGHAPDYRWLSGELRYSPARRLVPPLRAVRGTGLPRRQRDADRGRGFGCFANRPDASRRGRDDRSAKSRTESGVSCPPPAGAAEWLNKHCPYKREGMRNEQKRHCASKAAQDGRGGLPNYEDSDWGTESPPGAARSVRMRSIRQTISKARAVGQRGRRSRPTDHGSEPKFVPLEDKS